jgi:probable F420-dependent oxidoreductase
MPTTFGCVLSSAIFGHTASPEAVRTRALQAEALGFDSIWFADHVVIPRQVASSYPYAAGGASPFDPNLPFYEPISVLNFLAGCTQRVRLGMHVLIIPYRHPILTAKMLATLDVLSGGRLILGAGVGWMAEEFAALGAPRYEERGAVTDEYLRLFKVLWTENDPRFDGKYVQVSDVGFLPKPVQKPHPPIWIGGHTGPALRRTAQLGDGWAPIGLRPPPLLEPTEMAAKIDQLKSLIRQAGRREDAVTLSFTAPISFAHAPSRSRPLLSGSPDEIAADFRQYQVLGVTNFNINFPGTSISEQGEAMERFAQEVMPLIAQG